MTGRRAGAGGCGETLENIVGRRAPPLPNPRRRATFSVLTPAAGVGPSQVLATVPSVS